MKEENKALRRVVDQTMKDFHDLQMKLTVIQGNNYQKKVNHVHIDSYLFILIFQRNEYMFLFD